MILRNQSTVAIWEHEIIERFILFIVLAALFFAVNAKGQTVGPMMGEVSSVEARFLYRSDDVEKDYRLSVFGPGQTLVGTSQATALPANDYVAKFNIAGLTPATDYTYQLEELPGGTIIAGPGGDYHFKTFSATGTPTTITAAFISCVNTSTAPVWERMELLGIDQLYLMGDTPYIDSADLAVIRQKHRNFLAEPSLDSLVRHTPVVGTWDDHDFGLNNSNGLSFDYGKPTTRQVFVEYRAHDQYGTGTEGVYNKVDHGPMEVFVLDPRWFSQTAPSPVDPSQKTCFGNAQWQWLLDSLRNSKAMFKVLAMGEIWQDKKNSETDDLFTYWYERDALLDMIRDEHIPGVVLVGGDIHLSRYLKHPQRCGYDVHDFITSPGHMSTIPSLDVYHPSLEWSLIQGNQFLTLTADTTLPDPTLTARYLTGDGSIQKEVVMPYSTLRPKVGKALGKELRAWWPFEGDFSNKTVLGTRIDAVPNNGAALVGSGGLRGGAVSLTRADSEYLLVPRSILHDNSAAHTVSLWCKSSTLPAHGTSERQFLMESTAEGTVSNAGAWGLSLGLRATTDSSKVNLQLNTYTLKPAVSTSTAPTAVASAAFDTDVDRSLFLNNWTQVSFTFDSQKFRLFVNGAFVSEHVLPVPGPISETGGLVIGGHRQGAGRNFDGDLDEIAIWSRVLEDAEMMTLYGGGTPPALPTEVYDAEGLGVVAYWPFDTDFTDSVSAHDLTPNNGAAIDAGGKFGGAAAFDKSQSQYARVDETLFEVDSDYSVVAWYQTVTADIGTATADREFVFEDTNYAVSYGLRDLGGGDIGQVYTNTSDDVNFFNLAGAAAGQGVWHHIAVTYNAATGVTTAYLDGVYDGQMTQTGTLDPSTHFIVGGHRGGTGRNFNGLIDDMAVYNVALTPTQAFALYSGTRTPIDVMETLQLIAMNPNPSVGSEVDPADPGQLSWDVPPDMAQPRFSVYLSTDPTMATGVTTLTSNLDETAVDLPLDLADDTTYYWCVDSTSAQGGPTYTGQIWFFVTPPTPVGLVAWWPFDVDADNAQGNSDFDGTLVGNAAISAEDVAEGAGALKIDVTVSSAASYVDVTDTVLIGNVPNRNTVVAWYKFEDVSGNGSDSRNFVWETNETWALSFGVRSDIGPGGGAKVSEWYYNGVGGSDRLEPAGDGPVIGTATGSNDWHHAAMVYDVAENYLKYYHDGVLVDQDAAGAGALLATPTGFHIGDYRDGTGGRNWDGYIDEVAVYDQALTEFQINQLIINPAVNCGNVLDVRKNWVDFDDDGDIDIDDLTDLAGFWLSDDLEADYNADGTVDLAEFNRFAEKWLLVLP